jgi:uncharacterized protein YeaO (DUF488 family)
MKDGSVHTREGVCMALQIKRVHDPILDSDGKRILVERDFPTDLSVHEAEMHSWYRDVAPSTELSEWYKANPDKYDEFKTKYKAELDGNAMIQPELEQLRSLCKTDPVTLLCATGEPNKCHCGVLKEYLEA